MNKYKTWYDKIIDHYKHNPPEKNYEIHHIIPRSLGGDNKPENLVKLSMKAHFVIHHLLTKIYDSHKVWYAFRCFLTTASHRRLRVTTRLFEQVKLKGWDEERRQKQSLLLKKLNQQKRKPVEQRNYICTQCSVSFLKEEFAHHPLKEKPFCCQSCAIRNTAKKNRGKKRDNSHLLLHRPKPKVKSRTKRVAWNKGLHNPLSSANGKRGAVRLSVVATGRKRLYNPDGSWTWEYPKNRAT